MTDAAEDLSDEAGALVSSLDVPATGGVRLTAAVLKQALFDIRNGHGDGCRGHRELVARCDGLDNVRDGKNIVDRILALSWLFGFCDSARCRFDHSEDPACISFRAVCAVLRLDEGELREALVRWDLRGCAVRF